MAFFPESCGDISLSLCAKSQRVTQFLVKALLPIAFLWGYNYFVIHGFIGTMDSSVGGDDSPHMNGSGPFATDIGGHQSTNKKVCKEGSVLIFSKNGRYYKCSLDHLSAKEDTQDSGHDHAQHYNYLYPKVSIYLLNQYIGSVDRICEGAINEDENIPGRCLLPTGDETNVNSPMPIRVRPWMKHASFCGQSMLLYYSSHTKNGIGLLALEDSSTIRAWRNLDVALSFQNMACGSLHSPSVLVDGEQERFYMYVHGHHCKGLPEKEAGMVQRTLLYISTDGISWEYQEQFLLWNLFDFTTPTFNPQDGHFYAMARAHPKSKNVVLCRSTSLEGPFQEGPVLGQGLRKSDLFLNNENMYVFFSMIGDKPERILLGSIDITSSKNWHDWKLLPGPRVLQPEYWYEHGNTAMAMFSEGDATLGMKHQLCDPRFLPDRHSDESMISGLLFYVVQGGRGVASARISINLVTYHDVISYRWHVNIRPEVLNSTSLAWGFEKHANGKSAKVTQLLITGVGRSGTTSACTLLQKFGIMVSHDNNVDCGPYPGPDGAVSWYDAFTAGQGRRYNYVLHLVRDPLRTINSRIIKCEVQKGNLNFVKAVVGRHEEFSDEETCFSFSVKHWVRRNSFVESHASWRVQAESFFSEPLSAWELCMAANFGRRCPDLSTIESLLKDIPMSLNSLYLGATISKVGGQQKLGQKLRLLNDTSFRSWESLEDLIGEQNCRYIQIAQDMAHHYGYSVPEDFTSFGYNCKFTRRYGSMNSNWDCFVNGIQAG